MIVSITTAKSFGRVLFLLVRKHMTEKTCVERRRVGLINLETNRQVSA